MSSNSTKTLESMSQAVWYNQWTVKKFESFLKGDILEVGCGIGNFTLFLKKYGNVRAIDINENYLKQSAEGGLKIGFGDIEKGKYFFGDQKFDCIVCLNVLEHISNDRAAIKNIAGLLKKDGNLILLVPAHPQLYGAIDESIGHYRRYTKEKVVNLIEENNLKIVKIRRLNFLGAIGWFISGRIFKNEKVSSFNIACFNLISPLLLLEDIYEPPFGTSILAVAKK
ncbi:class I SAM-dependent methyltransferase [Candidatus Daviesbacteria bacterium]|nr:class I SAM-dependent methyltransferase [Candidatus Daviesbacteria bacterium]